MSKLIGLGRVTRETKGTEPDPVLKDSANSKQKACIFIPNGDETLCYPYNVAHPDYRWK